MPQDKNSRYGRRTEGKKSSRLMYIFAGFFAALLLIFMTNFFIGSGKDSEFVYGPTTPDTYKDEEKEKAPDDSKEQEKDQDKDEKDKSSEQKQDEKDKADEDSAKEDDEVEVTKKPSDKENVEEVITGDWKPVETEQQGEHVTTYTKGSQDWNEMIRAIETATGVHETNMTVWWLGNGGSPNTSTATISSKDGQETYRVNLQWVDGQGWKPVQVEVLTENPHG